MMTFVVTDDNRDRLNEFAQLLLSTFSGSILYLHTKPKEVIVCLRDHQVDAVFIEADMKEMTGTHLLLELRERNYELPAFILADIDEYENNDMRNNADGYLIRPISENKLLNSVRSAIEQKGKTIEIDNTYYLAKR